MSKPRYEEFTPEEIEDLDDTCAELAEENSALQERVAELVDVLKELYAVRSHVLNAAQRNATTYGSTSQCARAFESARQAIAKAEEARK